MTYVGDHNLANLSDKACEIAFEAGKAIMPFYMDMADLAVFEKHDNTPLTEADQAAHTYICDKLAMTRPNYPIISEESEDRPSLNDDSTYWLVDPLDGTKEFIDQQDNFTVNIALIDKQVPVLGAIYVPAKELLYYAVQGFGTYKLDNGQKQQLTGGLESHTDSWRIIASARHGNEATNTFLQGFDNYRLQSIGSALKFCLLAEGEADIYPRLAPTMVWDTAAGQCLVENAGGAVVDQTGNKLGYRISQGLVHSSFIACRQRSMVDGLVACMSAEGA